MLSPLYVYIYGVGSVLASFTITVVVGYFCWTLLYARSSRVAHLSSRCERANVESDRVRQGSVGRVEKGRTRRFAAPRALGVYYTTHIGIDFSFQSLSIELELSI